MSTLVGQVLSSRGAECMISLETFEITNLAGTENKYRSSILKYLNTIRN